MNAPLTLHPETSPSTADQPLSLGEIAECAHKIATECGVPEVHEGTIWPEAERRLLAARQVPWRLR